jgi:CO/xanthine dehydrogenase Mo-binding subunit
MASGESEWVSVACEVLGIDKKKVKVICDSSSPDSGPDTSSRGVTVLSKLVEQACLSIQKKRSLGPLPVTVRKTSRPQRNTAWEESFPPPEKSFPDCSGFVRPGCAAAVVEVEIDPVEYIPRIKGVWMGVDGGKIICEDSARRELRISAVQALGWAYREQMCYTDGLIPREQFEGFDIFGPSEIPQINIEFINNNSEDAKGVGDVPFSCIPAAYAQAVSQAADSVFRSVPLNITDVGEEGKGVES